MVDEHERKEERRVEMGAHKKVMMMRASEGDRRRQLDAFSRPSMS